MDKTIEEELKQQGLTEEEIYDKIFDEVDDIEDLEKVISTSFKTEEKGEEHGLQEEEQKQEQQEEEVTASSNEPTQQEYELEINGVKTTFNPDELYALAQRLLTEQEQLKDVAKYKDYIQYLDGIDKADLVTLKDIMSGNKEALQYLANKYNIDIGSDDFSLFDEPKQETKYEPKVEEKQEEDDPVLRIYNELLDTNPSLANKVTDIFNALPSEQKAELWRPEIFKLFIGSVDSGEWERVYPLAQKMLAIGRATTLLQAYAIASQEINKEPEQKKEEKQIDIPEDNKTREIEKKEEKSYDDYWEEIEL